MGVVQMTSQSKWGNPNRVRPSQVPQLTSKSGLVNLTRLVQSVLVQLGFSPNDPLVQRTLVQMGVDRKALNR